MINISNFSLNFNKQKNIFDNFSVEIKSHQITALIGKSGGGKTTLLRSIVGLEERYTGNIFCDGSDLLQLRRQERAKRMGFVFQHFNLFPHLTVLENCLYPLSKLHKRPKKDLYEGLSFIFKTLRLESLEKRYPLTLSGGEKQRVAIARALALDPSYLLLDEPTSALDPENVAGLGEIMFSLKQRGVTLVFASHDIPFVEKMADRVICLNSL